MLKKARKERLIWLDIVITLLTLELMSFFYYGARSLVLAGGCMTIALAAELISLRLTNKKFTADDLTCTTDGLIIALMMPAVIDYKIAALAVLFGIIAAKNVFGGRSNMIFSPAAAAYVFVLTSWGRELLLYTKPHVKTGILENAEGLINSASHTFNLTGKVDHTDFEILLGNFVGPSGAVSILLLIISAVILILRRDISAGAFIGTILGTGLFAYLTPMIADRSDSVKYSLITNMVLFSAIYIVSDRRIAPKREYYAFFYGLFIGIISYVLVLTTAKENAIVIVSVLFTPIALGFKNLEKRIELAAQDGTEQETAAETAPAEEQSAAKAEVAPDDEAQKAAEEMLRKLEEELSVTEEEVDAEQVTDEAETSDEAEENASGEEAVEEAETDDETDAGAESETDPAVEIETEAETETADGIEEITEIPDETVIEEETETKDESPAEEDTEEEEAVSDELS